jgi:hypothetical protein
VNQLVADLHLLNVSLVQGSLECTVRQL